MPNPSALVTLGLILIFSGFIVAFLSVLLMFLKDMRAQGKSRGGGLIMIGPIPIIFGTDKESVKILIALSVVLMVLVLALMLLLNLF